MYVHGEYNYHNILMIRDGYGRQEIATVNFEQYKSNVQVEDLYYFLRKVMEKQGWKERLGDGILNAYSAISPLERAGNGVSEDPPGLPGEILEDRLMPTTVPTRRGSLPRALRN